MDDRAGHVAALLDRDGTIIVDTDFVRDPDTVTLLPGAAQAIRALAQAGIPSIVFTNQSGIARGIISLEQYRAVRQRIADLLAAERAELLDTFCCPHHPDFTGPCGCRKPATELYERAASLYRLDLARCLFVGDKERDVEPAKRFGAHAMLVTSNWTTAEERTRMQADGVAVVPSLLDGVQQYLSAER